MGEFFRGWRRKIGMLTLMLALVFMGGWVRSLVVRDDLMVSTGKESTAYLSSLQPDICFCELIFGER